MLQRRLNVQPAKKTLTRSKTSEPVGTRIDILRALIACWFLAGAIPAAYASNWVFIDADKNRIIQTDGDSVRPDGDDVTAVTRTTYVTEQHMPGADTAYKYDIDTYEYNCARGSFRLIATNKVASSGYVIYSAGRTDSPPSYGTAGTIGAKMFEVACTKRDWFGQITNWFR